LLRPELAVDDAETAGGLLGEMAGSPRLPSPVRQQAPAWAVVLQGLAGGPGGAAADLDVKVFGG
jgi:hypothetical protein